jgi:hypothetical protein
VTHSVTEQIAVKCHNSLAKVEGILEVMYRNITEWIYRRLLERVLACITSFADTLHLNMRGDEWTQEANGNIANEVS